MHRTSWLFLLILAATLSPIMAACGPASTPTEATSPVSTPVNMPVSTPVNTPASTPVSKPVSTPAATELPNEAQETVASVRQDLADRLGIPAEQIALVSVEAVDWPETSLGCPKPGMGYIQVITPGYLIVLGVGGERYEYHTGGGYLVLCEESENTAGEATALPPKTQSAVELAKQDLSGRLGVPEAQIKVESVETVEWPDSSLGCPKPGFNYMQVITPGYRIVLEAGGERHEYHTDRKGNIVYCK